MGHIARLGHNTRLGGCGVLQISKAGGPACNAWAQSKGGGQTARASKTGARHKVWLVHIQSKAEVQSKAVARDAAAEQGLGVIR